MACHQLKRTHFRVFQFHAKLIGFLQSLKSCYSCERILHCRMLICEPTQLLPLHLINWEINQFHELSIFLCILEKWRVWAAATSGLVNSYDSWCWDLVTNAEKIWCIHFIHTSNQGRRRRDVRDVHGRQWRRTVNGHEIYRLVRLCHPNAVKHHSFARHNQLVCYYQLLYHKILVCTKQLVCLNQSVCHNWLVCHNFLSWYCKHRRRQLILRVIA